MKNLYILGICIVLVSCSSLSNNTNVDEQKDKTFITPDRDTSKPVLSLIKKARVAAKAGNLSQARADIERAIRIEPRNASLWHYLGKLSLLQKKYKDSINFARKSNQLLSAATSSASKKNELARDNWRMVAHAKYQLGDIDGAKQAQKKANQLEK